MEFGREIRHGGSEPQLAPREDTQRGNIEIPQQTTAREGDGAWRHFRGAAFDNILMSDEMYLGKKQRRGETPVVAAPWMC